MSRNFCEYKGCKNFSPPGKKCKDCSAKALREWLTFKPKIPIQFIVATLKAIRDKYR